MKHTESRLQSGCVQWFRLQYPSLAKLLIAVPNGGRRGKIEASIMKGEGVTAGVSDLLLLIPRKKYGCLGIEMKIKGNYQSVSQKQWQERFEAGGNKYAVCHSLDEFMSVIKDYL